MTGTTTRHALVIGATQGTGALIVEKLLAAGWQVSVLARSTAKAATRFGGQPVTIIAGDLGQPASLPADFSAYDALILTAGVTKRPVLEDTIRRVEYDGTLHLLDKARTSGFQGRFMYMNSIGTERGSWLAGTLNLVKGKTLIWRKKAEAAIAESGLPYTVIRAGLLNDKPGGAHRLTIDPGHLALRLSTEICREDVADVFVAALDDERTTNRAFNVVWAGRGQRQPAGSLFDALAAVRA